MQWHVMFFYDNYGQLLLLCCHQLLLNLAINFFFHVWYYERRLSKKIDSIPCQVMNFYISNTSMLFDPELHSREKHWKKNIING